MQLGLTGPIFRGGQPIGMAIACDLSHSVLELALEKNPDSKHFTLTVNQFDMYLAQRIRDEFRAYHPDILIDVRPNGALGKEAYLIEPSEG